MITYVMTIEDTENGFVDIKLQEIEDKFSQKLNDKAVMVKTTAEATKKTTNQASNKVDNLSNKLNKCATKDELKKYKKE